VSTTANHRSGSGRLPGINKLSNATKTTLAASAGVAIETSPLCSERKVPTCPQKKSAAEANAQTAKGKFHPDGPASNMGTKRIPNIMLLKKSTDHDVTPRPSAIFRQSAAAA